MKDPFVLAEKLIRLKNGSLDESERQQIEQFFSSDPELADLMAELDSKERIRQELLLISAFDTQKAAARLGAKRKRHIRRLIAWGAAAAVILVAGVNLLVRFAGEPAEEHLYATNDVQISVPTLITSQGEDKILSREALDMTSSSQVLVLEADGTPTDPEAEKAHVRYNTVVIPAGYTYKVQLGDGSVVTLDAGSELRFPETFSGDVREVEFIGNGYFQVAKSGVPFVVKAGDSRLVVYGTSFNLYYSSRLSVAEAVLVEGSIGMSAGSGQEIRITPNQRLCFALRDGSSMQETVDPAEYTAWLENNFKYKAARLDRIVYDISRWYGVDIRLDSGMAEQTYSLEFDKSSSVEWVMASLEKIINRNIKKKGGEYDIE